VNTHLCFQIDMYALQCIAAHTCVCVCVRMCVDVSTLQMRFFSCIFSCICVVECVRESVCGRKTNIYIREFV